MTDKQAGAAGALTNNSLFAAALAVAGALYLSGDAPLEKLRPDTFETAPNSRAYHDIEARSWQDPLAAAETHRQADEHGKAECAQQPDSKHCRQLIEEIGGSPDAAILAVTIPGGPFNEDAEVRRRLRYAVAAGLIRAGYFPEDSQRLDYFRLPAAGEIFIDIPYEWFRSAKKEGDKRVVVLWVNEDGPLLNTGPNDGPVAALEKLFQTLVQGNARAPIASFYFCGTRIPGAQQSGARPTPCQAFPYGRLAVAGENPTPTAPAPQTPQRRLAVLGPWTSDTYLRMRREKCDQKDSAIPFKLYVYGASLTDRQITDALQQHCAPFAEAWRTVPDDRIATALVDELEKRGLFLNGLDTAREGAVALLTDMDSLYGRSVAEITRQEIEKGRNGVKITVKSFFYLRGLDGSLPGKSKGVGEGGKPDERAAGRNQNDGKIDARAFDRPFGPSQADYLRRIADKMKKESAQYDFRAIGVLGNDVYDKLWVLRALRPKFPNMIFFTTDYDAALAMKSELKFTRNLVIASGFGDRLDPADQHNIPPFRAAYQTSAFLATTRALAGFRDDLKVPEDPKVAGNDEAQLFEITRDGDPMPLPMWKTKSQLSGDAPWGRATGLLAAAAWLVFIGRKRGQEVKSSGKTLPFQNFIYLLATAIAAAGLATLFRKVMIGALTDYGIGEPIGFFEGVGIWPVIGLRLLFALISALLTWRACIGLNANLREVRKEFFIGENRPAGKLPCIISRQLIDPFLAYRIDAFSGRQRPFRVEEGWREYTGQGNWRLRLTRCLLWSLVALSVFALVGGFDAPPPMRSALARFSYDLALGANFFATCFLTLFIFDATILSVSFVDGLGREQTEWPRTILEKYKEKLGLDVKPTAGYVSFIARMTTTRPEQHESGAKPNMAGVDKDELSLLDYWIDLVFIEKHTGFVNGLVYYPFVAVALSLLAHGAWLSAYPGSELVAMAEGVGLLVVFCCALALRWAAERARRTAERKFVNEIVRVGEKAVTPDKWGRSQLETMLARIRALDAGAFSPLLEQPAVRALLLPIGSVGLTALQDLPRFLGFPALP